MVTRASIDVIKYANVLVNILINSEQQQEGELMADINMKTDKIFSISTGQMEQ